MRDPRRRFMFGFAMETMVMKFWYVDQAGSFMTLPLDWITDVSIPFS